MNGAGAEQPEPGFPARRRPRWRRNLVLVAAGGGFMLGLVLLANPGHFGTAASLAGGVLSAGMVVMAVRTYRAG